MELFIIKVNLIKMIYMILLYIYVLDILYFVTALFFILSSIISFLFGLITEKCSKNKNKKTIKNKPNEPLLPFNTDANKV